MYEMIKGNREELIYCEQKQINTISAISLPHHLETNMGRWIHVTIVQMELDLVAKLIDALYREKDSDSGMSMVLNEFGDILNSYYLSLEAV